MYRFFIGVLIPIGLFASWQFLKAGPDQLAMAVLASGAFIAIGLLAIADNQGAVKMGQKQEQLPTYGCSKGLGMNHPFVTKLKGKSPLVIFEAIFAEMVIPNSVQVIDNNVTSWSESATKAQACRAFSVELVDGDGDVWMADGKLSMTMDTVQGHIVELELLIDDQLSTVVIDGEFEEQELMESCFK